MADYTEEFQVFWAKYPKRWNRSSGKYYKVGKWEASQIWKRLSQKDKTDILLKVNSMQDGEFILDAHRWLKKRRFDDIEIPKPKPKSKLVVVPKIIESPEVIAAQQEKGRKWKAEYEKRKKRLFMKEVPDPTVNVNNERNRQKNKLGIR